MINRITGLLKKTACAVCMAAMVLSLAACGKKSVEGKWSCQQNGAETTYEFNADGTGSMDIGEGIVMPITYSFDNGRLKISYTTLGTQNDIEYNAVIDKNTLTLTNDTASLTLDKQN